MIEYITRIGSALIVLCFLSSSISYAQGGDNPFELTERVGEEALPAENTIEETAPQEKKIAPLPKGNPFEVRPEELLQAALDSIKKAQTPVEEIIVPDPDNPFEKPVEEESAIVKKEPEIKIGLPEAPEGSTLSHFWLGGIFISILALLAFLNNVFRTELRNTFRAFTNSNILNLLYREKKDLFQSHHFWFYLFFVINMGVFLFLAGEYLIFFDGGILFLLGCILMVGLVVLLRHSLWTIIRKIFPFDKELGLFSYVVAVYNQMIGLFLLPFSLALAFSPTDFKLPILYSAFAVLLLVYLYRTMRGLMIANKFLAFHKFHFFVYLCTVEIAPVAILVKFMTDWGSVV